MRIREANLSDVTSMGRVTVDTFLASHRSQIPEEVWLSRQQNWTHAVSGEAWERTLCEIANGANPQECVYVAEGEAGEIIGLAMGVPADADASGTTGKVCALYVHPDHQRQGAGHCLVGAVAAHLAQRGMTTMQIEVLKANTPSRRFYEALGGQVVAEREVEDAGFLLPLVVYEWSDIGLLASLPRPEPGQ